MERAELREMGIDMESMGVGGDGVDVVRVYEARGRDGERKRVMKVVPRLVEVELDEEEESIKVRVICVEGVRKG
jgi:hypothetical protein